MKYIILLGDGMADEPMTELDGKTPLEAAHTPNMDQLCRKGQVGLAATVPDGYPPGSDVANLSVFGYNPADCYSGRSPLEAASMGVELGPDDVAFRLNFVWLEAHFGKIYMGDFSAGHISTEEATELIQCLHGELGGDEFHFYPGVSYRHLMVWKNGKDQLKFTPPHDISTQSIEDHLPQGEGAAILHDLMNSAQMLLLDHPVNNRRVAQRQLPANSIWLWGHGRRPTMETYQQRYGLSGAVISAVDLIRGIGVNAGLDIIQVPGATGYIDTNYRGKAEYAIDALKSRDFVYLHVEAPDEAAHGGLLKEKIEAIEHFDREVVGTIINSLEQIGDCRILVTPDHPTPIAKRTHTRNPVPFVLYDSRCDFASSARAYSEQEAAKTGYKVNGHELMNLLLDRP
ncbi:cofactor-independent phosphoglycerate mutase [Pelovirga terrestris]|uniref:Cofactor-independent phosphoglycerate mutase n=1 Tax=Pelovirga terrestris TaxID=2771352 RepID=A0A8J6QTC0_9BACT|nr:cofactor-independent phosphoglycerate mutase [Pelovirga terrestris]MBD1399170.1 cofactor-independent phosphoglycerate mutase [Pelovirga terrestris]